VYEQEKLSSGTDIVVTTGGLSQPYTTLGPVHADTIGTINVGSALNDALFRGQVATHVQASPKATVPQMNERLKQAARNQWGRSVDAIINVAYQTDPDGDLYADGLAVQFVIAAPPQPAPNPPAHQSVEERLQTLKRLLHDGLISQQQYEKKQAELLREL
jgi:hypothetical protein